MRTYKSYKEAYKDIAKDLRMDLAEGNIVMGAETTVRDILNRIEGDIAYLDRHNCD